MTAPPQSPKPSLVYASLLVGVCLLAWAPILVRVSETGSVATAFWRCLLALPFFVFFLKHTDYESIRRHWKLIGLCGLGLGGDLALWHMSIARIDVGAATVLVNLAPLFVGLWIIFSTRRISLWFFAAQAIALVGVTLLVGIDFSPTTSQQSIMSPLGIALGIAAAVGNALYLVSAAKLRENASARAIMGGTTLAMTILLAPLTLFAGPDIFPHSTQGWITLAALAVLIQILAQGCLVFALAYLPVTFASLSLVVQTVGAAALGWVLFDEVLGGLQIVGGVLAIGAVVLAKRTTSNARMAEEHRP